MTDKTSLAANAERAAALNKAANDRVLAMPEESMRTRSGAFEAAFWMGYGYAMAQAICLGDVEMELADAESILRPILDAMGGGR